MRKLTRNFKKTKRNSSDRKAISNKIGTDKRFSAFLFSEVFQQTSQDINTKETILKPINHSNRTGKFNFSKKINLPQTISYNRPQSVQGSRSIEEFKLIEKISEGTFGVVYKANDIKNNEMVAMKRLKIENENENMKYILREIKILDNSKHENIVNLREVVMNSNMDKIYLVMDFIENDLRTTINKMNENKQEFCQEEVKYLIFQLLKAMEYLHENEIIHRDLKPSNLLLTENLTLKVADFGLARECSEARKYELSITQPLTSIVVTLWYRAPELLLGIKNYTNSIDIWSIGCIFGELILMSPVFPGKNEFDEISKIFQLFGTPTDMIWPGYSNLPIIQDINFKNYQRGDVARIFHKISRIGINLLEKFLIYEPNQRINCKKALEHEFFE